MGEKIPATGMRHTVRSSFTAITIPNSIKRAKYSTACGQSLLFRVFCSVSPPFLLRFTTSVYACLYTMVDMGSISPHSIHIRRKIASSDASSIFEIECDAIRYAMKVVRADHVS